MTTQTFRVVRVRSGHSPVARIDGAVLVAVADRHARRTAEARSAAESAPVAPATLEVERDIEEAASDLVERAKVPDIANFQTFRTSNQSIVAAIGTISTL